MLVADLQSWAKCSICGTIMWVEQSIDEQRCVCKCGAIQLHDEMLIGTDDDKSFSESDMQTVLDSGTY